MALFKTVEELMTVGRPLFFDTCALVRLVKPNETGSKIVRRIVADHGAVPLWTSPYAIVETFGVLKRDWCQKAKKATSPAETETVWKEYRDRLHKLLVVVPSWIEFREGLEFTKENAFELWRIVDQLDSQGAAIDFVDALHAAYFAVGVWKSAAPAWKPVMVTCDPGLKTFCQNAGIDVFDPAVAE